MPRAAFSRYIQDVCKTRVTYLAFLMAAWFVSNGLVGLVISHDFPMHPTHAMYVAPLHAFGFIPVAINGWHAVFHLITGVAGLLCVRTRTGAIGYAAITAVIYWAMAIVCVTGGMSVCSVMAVDTLANWVHGTEGLILAAIAAYGLLNKADHPAIVAV